MREKEKLLDLLEEKEIRDKIREIVCAEERSGDRQEMRVRTHKHMYSEAEVQNRIMSVREECARAFEQKQQYLVDECNHKIVEMNRQLEEAERQVTHAKTEAENMREKYSELEYVYGLYSQFDSEQLKWFDKVLHAENRKADSPLTLVVWATQKENLTSMWEIISLHINELERKDRTKLFADFFECCFRLYATTTRGKAVLDKPDVGASYEPLKHSKTVDSRVAGVIEAVVLPGYTIGGETSKAIVRVQ